MVHTNPWLLHCYHPPPTNVYFPSWSVHGAHIQGQSAKLREEVGEEIFHNVTEIMNPMDKP